MCTLWKAKEYRYFRVNNWEMYINHTAWEHPGVRTMDPQNQVESQLGIIKCTKLDLDPTVEHHAIVSLSRTSSPQEILPL